MVDWFGHRNHMVNGQAEESCWVHGEGKYREQSCSGREIFPAGEGSQDPPPARANLATTGAARISSVNSSTGQHSAPMFQSPSSSSATALIRLVGAIYILIMPIPSPQHSQSSELLMNSTPSTIPTKQRYHGRMGKPACRTTSITNLTLQPVHQRSRRHQVPILPFLLLPSRACSGAQ